MKVIVIGGGPAGMIAAYSAQKEGNDVTLIEKNDSLGKKLLITGKGRCNITSSLDISDFIQNIPGNGRFLHSAFQNFNNKDILKLIDIPVKKERGNRVFPKSDKAQDVLNALLEHLNKVKIITNIKAEKILFRNNKVTGIKTSQGEFRADKIILATGGLSYPLTGSTGDGYKIAKELGHNIIPLEGSLVAMKASKESINICKQLQGLNLKNVSIKVYESEKRVYEDFGEMLFTHFGISGPIILSASAHLVRTKMQNAIVEIDIKPALSEEKLEARVLRDFEKYKNKEIKNALDDLLPKKMISVIITLLGINGNKKVNEITKEERKRLVKLLKCIKIKVSGFRDVSEAIITKGGIDTREINPKTMESKLIKGLFFAGEIIDVDGYTGGFNLQIAYSTGFTAGLN